MTADRIERGVHTAQRGVALNGEVLQSLEKINRQIARVAEVTGEISAAAEQQADGVAQVNLAVGEINAVTQQVAANAEESASAATELESQAQMLRESVGQFTLTTPASARTGRPAGTTSAPRRRTSAAQPATRPATHRWEPDQEIESDLAAFAAF
jgi:methyl-accepting chemotaxis protein